MTDSAPTRILTVRDLVAALQSENQDALVVATWEGILRAITVYHAKDGTVLVDADGGSYRSDFEKSNDVVHGVTEAHIREALLGRSP